MWKCTKQKGYSINISSLFLHSTSIPCLQREDRKLRLFSAERMHAFIYSTTSLGGLLSLKHHARHREKAVSQTNMVPVLIELIVLHKDRLLTWLLNKCLDVCCEGKGDNHPKYKERKGRMSRTRTSLPFFPPSSFCIQGSHIGHNSARTEERGAVMAVFVCIRLYLSSSSESDRSLCESWWTVPGTFPKRACGQPLGVA